MSLRFEFEFEIEIEFGVEFEFEVGVEVGVEVEVRVLLLLGWAVPSTLISTLTSIRRFHSYPCYFQRRPSPLFPLSSGLLVLTSIRLSRVN